MTCSRPPAPSRPGRSRWCRTRRRGSRRRTAGRAAPSCAAPRRARRRRWRRPAATEPGCAPASPDRPARTPPAAPARSRRPRHSTATVSNSIFDQSSSSVYDHSSLVTRHCVTRHSIFAPVEPDQLAVLLVIHLQARVEFARSWRARARAPGSPGSCSTSGIFEHLADLGVQPVDDRPRRARRREHADPRAHLVAGHAGLRDASGCPAARAPAAPSSRRAGAAGRRGCASITVDTVASDAWASPGHQRGHLRRAALVRHVHQLSMPVIEMNSAIDRCGALPLPEEE